MADFSPDEKIIALAYSYRIYFWDIETGKIIRRLVDKNLKNEASQTGIYKVKFSNNGKLLLSTGFYGGVKIWDVATGELKLTLPIKDKVWGRTLFSKDNKLIATAGSKGKLSIWDISTGKMLWEKDTKNFVPNLSNSEVGLVSVETGDIYDVKTGTKLDGITGQFLDNGYLLLEDEDKNVSTWKVERID